VCPRRDTRAVIFQLKNDLRCEARSAQPLIIFELKNIRTGVSVQIL
jgi:hypothetical protein